MILIPHTVFSFSSAGVSVNLSFSIMFHYGGTNALSDRICGTIFVFTLVAS